MRLALSCLAAATLLAACDSTPARGPSTSRGLPVLQDGPPPSGGAGGVVPLERPPGSRGGSKGS